MAYATTDDVAAELGRPSSSPAETAQWAAWIDRVERAIERGFRRRGLVLADRVTLGDPEADDVRDVEVSAVIRKVWQVKAASEVTPGTSRTSQVDDGSITRRNDGKSAIGYEGLDLSADEWAALLPAETAGAFSIRPYYEPDRLPYPLDFL